MPVGEGANRSARRGLRRPPRPPSTEPIGQRRRRFRVQGQRLVGVIQWPPYHRQDGAVGLRERSPFARWLRVEPAGVEEDDLVPWVPVDREEALDDVEVP